MNEILSLTNVNYTSLFISIITILIGMKATVSIFEWFINKLGLETKWMREKRQNRELLLKTSENLMKLHDRHEKDIDKSDKRDEEIYNDIKKLTQMFIDKEIDDMRWEINSFATKVAEGKPCNKDSFTHCIHIYKKYENILEENNMENGEVEISMEIINDAYKQKLKDGF
ncbi:hypothetical protein C823_007633 [Eubacterium plexicaudatum ASF492]|uniref:Uncharacterized protein n=1 Tax=Eubacterium plexicaudatum ASF492 TaxID=1235802 RepID=N1ZZX0_9FIRM|nr:hypothetical protein C823_007633 [Eubacterium plexicaudatum ASF492]